MAVEPLPENGAVRMEGGLPALFTLHQQQTAPLKIHTKGKVHHYIKLVDAKSNKTTLAVFVHAGKQAEISVPLGNYKIRYATGTKWQGYLLLFGNETRYGEAKSTFNFRIAGNQVFGYSVYLYPLPNGNLQTKPIRKDQF